jgi:hypothetical protein
MAPHGISEERKRPVSDVPIIIQKPKETVMKTTLVTAFLLVAATFSPALAQSGTNSATTSQSSSSSSQTAVVQKIQDDLKKAGFTDIKVVAESYVVQAKTKDGNPVLMTIGPHGMSVFEALNTSAARSGTTGNSQGTSGSSSSSNNGAAK